MDTNETKPTAGLDALSGMTKQLDGANLTPDEQKQRDAEKERAKGENAAREWAQIPRMLGGLVCMIEPQLAQFYTVQACNEWGKAAHATATKYEWKTPDNLPELALVSSTIGFALPTFLLVRSRVQQLRVAQDGSLLDKLRLMWSERAARRAKAKADKKAPDAAPGGAGGKPPAKPAPVIEAG